MTCKILAVCTGIAQPVAAKSGRTGHFKVPQLGEVRIGPNGLDADTIVDRVHHGGPEQAVYVFGEADRVWWQAHLERMMPAGYFGENLLIEGLCSADLALGDVLEIGKVRLQITAPRIPCVTFAARIGDPQGVKIFHAAKRPGAYARVLQGGAVSAWDRVTHIPYDGDRITVVEHMDAYLGGLPDAFLRRALAVPAHAKLHQIAQDRLDGGA